MKAFGQIDDPDLSPAEAQYEYVYWTFRNAAPPDGPVSIQAIAEHCRMVGLEAFYPEILQLCQTLDGAYFTVRAEAQNTETEVVRQADAEYVKPRSMGG